MGPRPMGPKEIDTRLLVPLGKASDLLTNHLQYHLSLGLPRKSGLVKPSIHYISLIGLLGW